VQTAREAALTKPTQAAGGTKLSNEDVEKLFAEFLEWNRHAKSPGK
jgi:hypothetical protein